MDQVLIDPETDQRYVVGEDGQRQVCTARSKRKTEPFIVYLIAGIVAFLVCSLIVGFCTAAKAQTVAATRQAVFVVTCPRIAFLQWRLDTAEDELVTNQASFEVGPTYLVNLMRHIAELRREIVAHHLAAAIRSA